MTFKKGDRVRHIKTRQEFKLYADQIGDLVWAGRKGYGPYPSTYSADIMELVPPTPEAGQVWVIAGDRPLGARYRVLTVCGQYVVYENAVEGWDLKYARTVDDFTSRFEYVEG